MTNLVIDRMAAFLFGATITPDDAIACLPLPHRELLKERLKLVEGQAAEAARFALAALSEPDDLPDVPLSERGFGV